MNKSQGFLSMLLPSAIVFLSSACLMIIELVAGRLIARDLGSSLYTWTAVIGVILAGITIGNYIGGRIADRFDTRKALSALFAFSSIACVIVIILNNSVGRWMWLWGLSWPVRSFTHVSFIFMLPSILLGTITPVVAKMALDRGFGTGRTVGDIYAAGAAGSIVGTFAAGYYLIAMFGTITIIWIIAAILLLMAVIFWVRCWPIYAWAAIFFAALTIGTMPASWAQNAGSSLALRERPNPNILYEDETQYCYVAVKRVSEKPDKRTFIQDKLVHSQIIMDDIYDLQYFHTKIFAAVTHGLTENGHRISVLHIGGGGYVFPQYIEKKFPGSRNDVAEIDSGVTKAAMEAFGLRKNTTINTITKDARNYVEELLEQQAEGKTIPRYDFIYEDACNDFSVPFQLVTKEFNDNIYKILTADGVYMVNSMDTYTNGRFIGASANTLAKTFKYVYVVASPGPPSDRKLFVLIASNRQIDVEGLIKQYNPNMDYWYLTGVEIETLKGNANNILLTDDYAPVENLLAPVVKEEVTDPIVAKLRKQARNLESEGKPDETVAIYEEIIRINPNSSIEMYHFIAFIRAGQGKFEQAAQAFQKALDYNEKTDYKENMATIHASLGTVLNQLGRREEAARHFEIAIQGFHSELAKKPTNIKTIINLGDTLASIGRFKEASEYFAKAVELDPANLGNQMKLAQVFEIQKRYDEAQAALKKAISFMSQNNDKDSLEQLQKYLKLIESERSQTAK